MSLKSLSRKMKKRVQTMERKLNEATVQVALVVIEAVAKATPVDTTKAMSNWQLKADYNETVLPPYSPGHKGDTSASSLKAVIRQARGFLRTYKGGEIKLFNNAPYIKRLNEGYSKQAPAGFIEISVLEARHKALGRVLGKLRVRIADGNDNRQRLN